MNYVDFLIICGINLVCLVVVFFLRSDVLPAGVDCQTVISERNPNSKDTRYLYGQEWWNSETNIRWVLERKQVTEDGLEAHWRDITQYMFPTRGIAKGEKQPFIPVVSTIDLLDPKPKRGKK